MWQTTNLSWLRQVKIQYLLCPISFRTFNETFAFLCLEILLFHYLPMRKSKLISAPWQPLGVLTLASNFQFIFSSWFEMFHILLPCSPFYSACLLQKKFFQFYLVWSFRKLQSLESFFKLFSKQKPFNYIWMKFLFLLFLYNTWITFWLLEFLKYNKYGPI